LNIRENIPLAPLTTFQVGGPARYFTEASTQHDVEDAVIYAADRRVPLFVLGGGSNLVVADTGFPGLVLKIPREGLPLPAIAEIRSRSSTRRDVEASPVFTVDFGSSSSTCASPVATGMCSTPLGTITNSPGPGNLITLEIESENVTEVFTGFGERGVAAEAVADQAVIAARRYLASDVAVGEHLADQLLLPMALARGGSFTTVPPSRHTTTNIEIIRKFLDVEIRAEQMTNRSWKIEAK